MMETGPVQSIEELLRCDAIQKARCIELSICDAVHFRLLEATPIFELTELHLQARSKDRFKGFAECRKAIEKAMRGATIKEKIEQCCTSRPEWLDDRQILYSTELEIWMDMSYPNPCALDLYHAALVAGKVVSIPNVGPFTETFHTLLKEKNGYELTEPSLAPDETVRVHVGEKVFLEGPGLQLVTNPRETRPDAFASEKHLAGQLVHGILEKDLEDHSAKPMEADSYREHALAYRLMGPTLQLLIQSLDGKRGPIAFTGTGASLLSALVDSLRQAWPWLPAVSPQNQAEETVSLFPEAGSQHALFPGSPDSGIVGLFSSEGTVPMDLLLPGIRLFMEAAFDGAGHQQAAQACAFVRDYACMTRGLYLPIPSGPVVENWAATLLSPKEDFLAWASGSKALKGFSPPQFPWQLGRVLDTGTWPTATYLLSGGVSHWWAKRQMGPKVQGIKAAIKAYAG